MSGYTTWALLDGMQNNTIQEALENLSTTIVCRIRQCDECEAKGVEPAYDRADLVQAYSRLQETAGFLGEDLYSLEDLGL